MDDLSGDDDMGGESLVGESMFTDDGQIKHKKEDEPTGPKVWTSPLPKPDLDSSLYGEKNIHELAEYIDWHKRNPRCGTPQLKPDRKHLKMPPISEWTHDNDDLYFPKQANFKGNDSYDVMGRPVVPRLPDEIHQPKFGDGQFDDVSHAASNMEFDLKYRAQDDENDFFNRNNFATNAHESGEGEGKDALSLGGSVSSWGTKFSVGEQMSINHELLSPRSLNMKEFDPEENMFDWRVVAKKQAAYRAKREKDAAEKRRKKEKKEFDWLQERNMHIHKDLANKDREQRQKSKPVWQSDHVWTQYTANGTLMDEWNINKMEALVRKALTVYFDEREASGEMGVVRRGEGHWKDEMKVLPPALTDLVNNVKSFFSPATFFSGPKHNEKKIVPTAEGKEEEMKAHLTADADAEAEQVLSGTCRHGRKRDECRECKEHSPDKKPDKNLLASKNNPDMKYVEMVEKLGGGEAVGKMADEFTKYAEKVRYKAQRQGEMASIANNPTMDIVDACIVGSAMRVVSSLATGDAEPNEEHEGNPVVHIAIKQALLLDEVGGAIYLNSPNIGDRAKFQKIIDVFHMYNCDFEILGIEGTCGLHMAAAHGNLKLIEYFLRKRVNINIRAGVAAHDLYGGTPIMFAAKFGHVEALAHLVRRGGSMELQAENGNTALHYAAEMGESRMCTFLMHIGADKRRKNKESLLAGQLASSNGHRVCAQTILEYAVMPEGPERLLTYLNKKLDDERDKHRMDQKKTKAKNIFFSAANKFFEGATRFVDDLLACIPYFRRKQEEQKRNKAIMEAANRIFKPSNAASHAVDDDSDIDDVVN